MHKVRASDGHECVKTSKKAVHNVVMKMANRKWVAGWTGAVVLLMSPAVVGAHQTDRAEQATEVRADDGEVENLYSISAEDLAHHHGHVEHGEEPTQALLDDHRDEFSTYIDDRTEVRADGDPCRLAEHGFVDYPGRDGRVHYRQLWDCPVDVHEIELENRIMLDHHHGGYRHMGRIQIEDDIYPTVFERQFPTYAVYPEYVGEDDQVIAEVDPPEPGVETAEQAESDDGHRRDHRQLEWILLIAVVVGTGLLVGFLERR